MKLKKEPEKLIKIITEMLHEYGVSSTDAAEGIEYILDNDLWKERDPSPGLLEKRTYKYFPEFCEDQAPWGLRTSYATVIDVCKRNDKVYHKVVEAGKQSIGKKPKDNVYNINNNAPTKGTSKAYGLSRLSKYRADLYELVVSGEMTTNEAMIEAGYREKTYTVKADPDYLVRWMKKHLTDEQIEMIVNELTLINT